MKAYHRGRWAERLLGKRHIVTKIFFDKYKQLTEGILKEHSISSKEYHNIQYLISNIEQSAKDAIMYWDGYDEKDSIDSLKSAIDASKLIMVRSKDLFNNLTKVEKKHNR
jgi:hypothetical protein